MHSAPTVTEPSDPGGLAAGRLPHCVDSCLLIRLGFGAKDRDELAVLAGRPETRAEVERAIAQRALADRLSSAAALAAGVAHELNNPLAYVTANLAFLAERMGRLVEVLSGAPRTVEDVDLATQLAEAMREARTGAERMRAVVRDLKTFARVEEERRVPVDVRPVIDSCLNLAWAELRRRAGLARDLEPVPPVLGDEGRLSQVFVNLVLNAAQSIPGGRPDDHEVRVATRTLPDGRVAIEVRDTGSGIDPAHLPKIFDPFFTTKGPGQGTGLGLSICHAVITSMGGEIEVESAVGRGSTFRVLLPPAPQEPPQRAQDAGPSAPPHPARILVVDDEPLVGAVLRRTLAEHDVTLVESADAALARIDAGDRFDVVLCDLLMPGTSGMDLYRAVAARDPSLARGFVFLTGGAFTPAARAFLESEPVDLLEKPFDVAALRAAIARRLAPPPAPA